MSEDGKFQKTVCVDFDGVLHSYRSGWQGAGVVSDEPSHGAIEWLRELALDPRFEVCIYSSRSKTPEGIGAMQQWLVSHGLPHGMAYGLLRFPSQKPPAWVTIDDRCIPYQGSFPELDTIDNFAPWKAP